MKALLNQIFIYLFAAIFMWGCKKDVVDGTLKEATYQVTFEFFWDAQTYPTDYPSNAHFSRLIGWSHQPQSDFFQLGTMASTGIKDMAERGKTTPLDNEITTKINSKEGLELFIGDPLSTGTGTITATLNVNQKHSCITLVTMLAPSPDWYAGVININLLENGEFVESKVVDGLVYDAGTDSGITFTSADSITTPPQPIALMIEQPLGDGNSLTPPLAKVRFVKL
ncbi:MAG: spondin domain-containing protein [Flavobacteriales bacterium]|nr:spondin domain-containing protein [Flavobacteriales bacterium]